MGGLPAAHAAAAGVAAHGQAGSVRQTVFKVDWSQFIFILSKQQNIKKTFAMRFWGFFLPSEQLETKFRNKLTFYSLQSLQNKMNLKKILSCAFSVSE